MNQLDLQLTGGNNKGTRRELDYYPTPPEVTHALMQFLKLPSDWWIWEPACGTGEMVKVLKMYSSVVIGSDVQETEYGIWSIDFLKANLTANQPDHAIITNPPFHLAEQFIRKACSEAPVVAMLLKSQYWHAASRYQLFTENPPTYVLPLTWRPDFLQHTRRPGEKGSPTMDVAWSVWIRGEKGTKYLPLKRPK